MNIENFTYLLNNPSEISSDHIESLQKMTRVFPYFQPARALLLKALKDQGNFTYNQELKITAAYTPDRSILFELITSKDFLYKEAAVKEKKSTVDIEVILPEEVKVLQRVPFDHAVRMKMEEAEDVLNPELFSSKEPPKEKDTQVQVVENLIQHSETEKKNIEKPDISTEDKVENRLEQEIKKPFEFTKNEKHSFIEWLKLSSTKPLNPVPEADLEKKIDAPEKKDKDFNKKNNFELIDEFIAKSPKIKPANPQSPTKNLAKDHQVAPDELMTETLARVYLAQKKYKNAIQAYKILILKNPEKSGFFADQIRAIKKLQENKP